MLVEGDVHQLGSIMYSHKKIIVFSFRDGICSNCTMIYIRIGIMAFFSFGNGIFKYLKKR